VNPFFGVKVFAAAKAVAIGMPFDGNSGGGPDALGALVCCGVGVTPKALRQVWGSQHD